MTLFGTALVGMIGWRSVRYAIRYAASSRCQHTIDTSKPMQIHQSQRALFHLYCDESNTSSTSSNSSANASGNARRTIRNVTGNKDETTGTNHEAPRYFWTWRGGDDKKWVMDSRGGWSDSEADMDIREQSSAPTTNEKYPNSYCTAQGYRTYMEDEFFLSMDGDFAAVFDGHGGGSVSKYLKSNLYAGVQAFLPSLTTTSNANDNTNGGDDVRLQNHQRAGGPSVEDYENAVRSALEKVDREVQRINHWSYQGSTAVAIWLHEERLSEEIESDNIVADPETDIDTTSTSFTRNDRLPRRTIIAANVGDSRAVLSRNGTAWDLTRDHKPNDPDEKARIESVGGKVIWCGDVDSSGEPIFETGIYRVNGNLALSRAIGDRAEKPAVSAEPEIISVLVKETDDFFILATDGLWDVMSSQESVDLVKTFTEAGCETHQISKLIVEEALRRGTYIHGMA